MEEVLFMVEVEEACEALRVIQERAGEYKVDTDITTDLQEALKLIRIAKVEK